MNSDTPKSLPGFLRAIRPRAQVLKEEWGSLDVLEISSSRMAIYQQSPPPYETWSKMKLPYLAPSAPPLPTMDELVQALDTNSLRARNGITPICRIGDTVVKLADQTFILDEAETMLFLAEKCPQLRIPKILAVWKDISPEGKDIYCFMMEHIEGIKMSGENFPDLPVHAQDIVCAKVAAQIRLLRSIPSEGYYGRVHRQGWVAQPTALQKGPEHSICGPFDTYEDFVSAMFYSWEKHQAARNIGQVWDETFESDTAELFSMFAGFEPNEPVFTWIDPKIANIIVQPVQKDDGTEDWDVVLIDWEFCGWYPAWIQGMQVGDKFHARECDRTQAPTKCGRYPSNPYRSDEVAQMVLNGFDPNPVSRVLQTIQRDWMFFG